MENIFDQANTDKKLFLLNFLKEQKSLFSLEFKTTVMNFLRNKGITPENIFGTQEKEPRVIVTIEKISSDGMLHITNNNDIIVIPIDYVKNVIL